MRAPNTSVSGQLVLDGAELSNPGETALLLQEATLSSLVMEDADLDGELRLEGAEIAVLRPGTRPPAPIYATGWSLGHVHGRAGESWKAAAAWLGGGRTAASVRPDEATNGPVAFVRQPWLELADAMERGGRPEEGRRLRLEAERRQTRHLRWSRRPLRWAYGAAVGYGLYPLLAGVWLALAALVTLGLAAGASAQFVPTDLVAATPGLTAAAVTEGGAETVTGGTSCARLAVGYPCFSPPVYALEVMLPVTQLGQVAAWVPQTAWVAGAVVVLRAVVWLMTALLLAGLTGLLRPSRR